MNGAHDAAMKIYLAARYSRAEEMRIHAGVLERLGFQVTSRWIMGVFDGPPLTVGAWGDHEDVRRADCLILFAETPGNGNDSRGGYHVEFGLAYAMGKKIFVVGERENIFHYLPDVQHFKNLAELITELQNRENPIQTQGGNKPHA